MEKAVRLSAIRVANRLDIQGIKKSLAVKPLADGSSELFYGFGSGQYLNYFNYGVVVFCGYSDEEISLTVKSIQPHLKDPEVWLRNDHLLKVVPGAELKFELDHLIIDHSDDTIVHIASLTLAQSLALDYYNKISDQLITEIKRFTDDLQSMGKMSFGRKNMLKFTGRALNTQNEIASDVSIFHGPEQVWEQDYENSLHKGFVNHLDLKVRISKVENSLRIIQTNLNVFTAISNQAESNRLEWIIIILILIEVFDLFITKLF